MLMSKLSCFFFYLPLSFSLFFEYLDICHVVYRIKYNTHAMFKQVACFSYSHIFSFFPSHLFCLYILIHRYGFAHVVFYYLYVFFKYKLPIHL